MTNSLWIMFIFVPGHFGKYLKQNECSKKRSHVDNKDNTMRLYRKYIRLKEKRFSLEEFHLLFLKRA